MTNAISCDLHDYLEIACLYKYEVNLQRRDNHDVLEGRAIDIVTKDQHEYLVIENDQRHLIDLSHLVKLTVLTAQPKFPEIHF